MRFQEIMQKLSPVTHVKDCNKTPPQSSRSQQCPICIVGSNNTFMSPNEFKNHMITIHRYRRRF